MIPCYVMWHFNSAVVFIDCFKSGMNQADEYSLTLMALLFIWYFK